MCDNYDRFGKNVTATVETEIAFIQKYTMKYDHDSAFLASFGFLCQFMRDLALNFNRTAIEIKSTMIEPMMQFQKQSEAKYTSIYNKHDAMNNKYISNQKHLSSHTDSYKKTAVEEANKFKLIRLLSASIMPSSDHKILKKSWHSPSKLTKSVSNFLKKAKSKTRRLSMSTLSDNDTEHKSQSNEPANKSDGEMYEELTKLELEHNQNEKRAHIPMLYAMNTYSSTRNKLIKTENSYVAQIESVNHSMSQYEYVRKESMKSLQKMEIERLIKSRNIYCSLIEMFGSGKFDILQRESYKEFEQSTKRLVPHMEFEEFLAKALKRYTKPKRLLPSKLLIDWRSPFHLFEDLIIYQIEKRKINPNTLKVPFIFEYLMEYLDNGSAVRDPDIFSLNAISPKDSDYAFLYQKQLHPEYKDDASSESDEVGLMKINDLYAIPILTKQVEQLYRCLPVNVRDHHHAVILFKLWLHKCPESIIPYYLYDRVCSFQLMNTVNERLQFVENEILSNLSNVRVCCLARLVDVCKKIVRAQNDVTIIDLSYELSNVIIKNPNVDKWRQLDPISNSKDDVDDVDDVRKFNVMMDPQSTYKAPLSPSDKDKRAEMAFITYILSNSVPMLTDKKIVNHGDKLTKSK